MGSSILICGIFIANSGLQAFMRSVFREEGVLKKPCQRVFIAIFTLLGVLTQQVGRKLFFLGAIESIILSVVIVNCGMYAIRILARSNPDLVYGKIKQQSVTWHFKRPSKKASKKR